MLSASLEPLFLLCDYGLQAVTELQASVDVGPCSTFLGPAGIKSDHDQAGRSQAEPEEGFFMIPITGSNFMTAQSA
jgi:hypothetical protein